MTPIAFALALMFAPGQPSPTEQAVARAISTALPPQVYDWSMTWSPFGVRLGREVRWHLSTPGANDDDHDLDAGVFRRVGWLSADQASAPVAVCGDRNEVRSMALSAHHLGLDPSAVIEALAPLDITAIEVSRDEAAIPPDVDDHYRSLVRRAPSRIAWQLRKLGHGEALMVAEHVCTPPGARSATVCWTRITLQFGAEDEAPTPCPLPGRWGV